MECAYEFDPPLDKSLECGICLSELKDPVQTPCGHRFCSKCLDDSIREVSEMCPIDSLPLRRSDLKPDNFAARMVGDSKVACGNGDCKWRGAFRLVRPHALECEFAVTPCLLSCGFEGTRGLLEEHKAVCPERLVLCASCGKDVPASQDHKADCTGVEEECAHCGKGIKRWRKEFHVTLECPQKKAKCPFAPLGCSYKDFCPRVATHLQTASVKHASLSTPHPHAIEALESRIAIAERNASSRSPAQREVCKDGNFVWFLHDVEALVSEGLRNEYITGKRSEPFFTGHCGYKMCLRINAAGVWGDPDFGRSFSLFLHVLDGPWDDALEWPIKGSATMTMVPVGGSLSESVKETFTFPRTRAFERQRAGSPTGYGYTAFAPISVLRSRTYNQGDRVVFKIKVTLNG